MGRASREADPAGFTKEAQASMAVHVRAMVEFQDRGAEVFDYGNSIRDEARKGGYDRAFEFPGFVPAYIRPLFCEGKGPFRWAALSGDPADIAATDRAILELFPDNERLHKWITMAGERVSFQGLPARICWLGYGERHLAGLKFNEMVASGELKAPVVIGRDHLDCGSVASPYRETEAMLDGSDAIADWAILNALVNTASGATWVSFHHGGGVGMGRSLHAGQVCVADGTDLAAAEDRAGADQRPRHGRDPPRRRRLRPRDRGRRRARRPHPDVRVVDTSLPKAPFPLAGRCLWQRTIPTGSRPQHAGPPSCPQLAASRGPTTSRPGRASRTGRIPTTGPHAASLPDRPGAPRAHRPHRPAPGRRGTRPGADDGVRRRTGGTCPVGVDSDRVEQRILEQSMRVRHEAR